MIGFGAFLTFVSLSCTAGPQDASPQKLALIVAVAKYPASIEKTLPALEGPRNDAKEARATLTTRFGFDADSIRTLVDEEATHENVVRAFHDHLIARAGIGTEVVFWYSGHGSLTPDASGFEATGFDSTLVLADSRGSGLDGAYDLTDDELSSLLDAAEDKGAHVLLVTDACHSGGMTRGGGVAKVAPKGLHALSKQLVAPFWPQDVELKDDDGKIHERPNLVHIAACTTEQEARERPFPEPDGTLLMRGCLTHGLCWFLNEAQPGDSFRSIADKTALWVEGLPPPDQTPTCSGAVDRELFSGSFAARPRGYRARLGEGREIAIEGGRLHGIRPSSEFTIESDAGAKIGRARTGFLGSGSTTAFWDGDVPSAASGVALRAILVPGSGGRDPLSIRFANARVASFLAERFKDRLIVAPNDAPDAYALTVASGTADDPGVHCEFLTPDGIPLWRGTWKEVADVADFMTSPPFDRFVGEFDAALENEAVYRELTMLPAEPGSLKLTASLSPPDAATLDFVKRHGATHASAAKLEVAKDVAGVARTYRATFDPRSDDLPVAQLFVRNDESDAVYLTVLSVSEDRDRTILHPAENTVDEVLPPSGNRVISISLNGDANHRFHRELRDRILVIATRQPVDFYALSGKTSYRSGGAPGVLERAFRGSATRGGSDDYGVTAIDVVIPAP